MSASTTDHRSESSGSRTEALPPHRTRIGALHMGLLAATLLLVLLVVFVVQNARPVDVNYLGAHARVSLAVALLLAAIAGALVIGVAGTARIAQLRRGIRRRARHPAPTASSAPTAPSKAAATGAE